MTDNHPCLSCRLPDCDDRDRRCALRKALTTYQYLTRAKQPIPDDLRRSRNLAHREFYVETISRSSAACYQRRKLANPEEKRP
jgi:hypothetical protein